MIRARTGARLHFGLLNVPGEAPGRAYETVGERGQSPEAKGGQSPFSHRFYGGAGLMVEEPAIELTAEPAAEWTATGPLAARALEFARRFAAADAVPCRIVVERAPAEHSGLGTGTQLGLAVARVVAFATGEGRLDAVALAYRVGRGERSALGVHGFDHGGFLVEGGKRTADEVSPLVARVAFPETWRVVLLMPSDESGVHGRAERDVFAHPAERTDGVEARCRLLLLGVLPALVAGDFRTFAEALAEFNARAGEPFAGVQGGVYSSPAIAGLVARLRRQGVRGSGQSSWGPCVWALAEDEEEAGGIVRRAGVEKAYIVRPLNRGVEPCEPNVCNRH